MVENNSFAERLKLALACSEISQTKLADELAARGHPLSNRAISAYVRGERKRPKRSIVLLMSQVLGVREEWLYSGIGEMRLPRQDVEIIEFWPVPLIGAHNDMDLQQEITDAKLSMKFHRVRRKPAANAFAALVPDNANWPDLKPATAEHDADVVVVAPGAPLKPGDFVYVEVRSKGKIKHTIRQYAETTSDNIELIPLNKLHARYAPGSSNSATVEIIGKVVELSRVF